MEMDTSDDQVLRLIQSNKQSDAIRLVIKNFNHANRKHPNREQASQLMMRIFLSVKSSEIESIVNSLDLDEIDVLMRYIYHGFEHPTEGSSAYLLTWHDKACNRGGVGSIVRVLTEH